MNFNKYKRVELIKLLRANKKYLPPDILRHSKNEMLEILNNATDLDTTITENFKGVLGKVKTPIEKVIKPVATKLIKKKVVLDELSGDDTSDDDEPVVKEPVVQVVKVEAKTRKLNKKRVTVAEIVSDNVVEPLEEKDSVVDIEREIRLILKDYQLDVRDMIAVYDTSDYLDDHEIKQISNEYNAIRIHYEDVIERTIQAYPIQDKFFLFMSKALDTQLEKVQRILLQ